MLTAVAWPYANGPRYIGHVSVSACRRTSSQFMRMSGNDVLMVSGTDEHGTPILVQAEKEELEARWPTSTTGHREDLRAWGVGRPVHLTTTQPLRGRAGAVPRLLPEWLASCQRRGRGHSSTTEPFRTATSRAPARSAATECPRRPVRQLRQPARPDRLDQPGVSINGSSLLRRDRALLPGPAGAGGFAGKARRADWRPNVLKFSQNLLEDLRLRAIPRLDWGVPIPLDEGGTSR